MNIDIYNPLIQKVLSDAQAAFGKNMSKKILLHGKTKKIPYPFPSPTDWRDQWIYFLMIDRFNNPVSLPVSMNENPSINWNQKYGFRQGGTFKGIEAQLDYLASLGAGAIWISPVLKNSKAFLEYNYHGYGIQDFLSLDEHFASDGTSATAEKELIELVDAIHVRGMYVIFDIVINHTARAFDYVYNGAVVNSFKDESIMNAPLNTEPPVQWLNGFGFPRSDWQNFLPDFSALSPDDAVWPADLHREDFFRRRGEKLSDDAAPGSFVRGDFGVLRQLVVEYDAQSADLKGLRKAYGKNPVLNILIVAYQYLIAKYDVDGFRMDTVKYVDASMVEIFGNAIREFALSIGKKNFFTFGEIYDDENTIGQFVGRNSSDTDGYGIDAALDFPLFFTLPGIIKNEIDVSALRRVFEERKNGEKNLLSSHGEAGKYFITFLDNHDQHQRFYSPAASQKQVLMGIAILFCLQGIPSVYYGTEQGLNGTTDNNGNPALDSFESVREALWGKSPVAFDMQNVFYRHIQQLGKLRKNLPALLYGRLYFREISVNKVDFVQPSGTKNIITFSRIVAGTEVLIVANTNTKDTFTGFVIVDIDNNRSLPSIKVEYSNLGTTGNDRVQLIENALFHKEDQITSGEAACIFVKLEPMEIQILIKNE